MRVTADASFRLRVSFAKQDRLRFLSHLEVTRACERSVRRAQLEYAVSKGFNPRMKIAFGPALPVGTAACGERYEVWLTRFVGAEEALARLERSTPAGLAPRTATYVGEGAPSLAASLTLADYRVVLSGPCVGVDLVQAGLERIVEQGNVQLEHKGKAKMYDLSACLVTMPVVGAVPGGTEVDMTTRMGEWGSLRPEDLLAAALGDALENASVDVTRTALRSEE